MSIAYIWWYKFFIVTRYGGHFVHNVHNFHAVLPALPPVAPGVKKERRRRQYYEKPSEVKRRARLQAERRALNARRAQTAQ